MRLDVSDLHVGLVWVKAGYVHAVRVFDDREVLFAEPCAVERLRHQVYKLDVKMNFIFDTKCAVTHFVENMKYFP